MKKSFGYSVVLALFGVSSALAACSDDPDAGGVDDAGGAGGEPTVTAGTKNTAGSATAGKGGSGNGGSSQGGDSGQGGDSSMGAAAGESMGGAGVVAGAGGADSSEAGAGGEGGGGAELSYACGDTTTPHKLCSAFVAASCDDPTDCADCVDYWANDAEGFAECAPCAQEYAKFVGCSVDAFESGNVEQGVECLEDYGADPHYENCSPHLNQALACLNYLLENECPASWPVEG